MTDIDISPEAVERRSASHARRGNYATAAIMRALSAALTLHQNDANHQCRERVKEWERANAAELALTQSRAETAAVIERAAEICETRRQVYVGKAVRYEAANNFDSAAQCEHTAVAHDWLIQALRALATPDQSSTLAAIQAAAEARGMRKAAEIAQLNAWCHQGADAYSQGMDAGARHQCKVINDAILATIPQGETK